MNVQVHLQFFRTKTRIKSGQKVSDESRFVMTFLIILGVNRNMQFQISSRRENKENTWVVDSFCQM